MDYAIYDPTVTTTVAVNPYSDPSGLTYVSNSSLTFYGGKYWAIMDGTTLGFVESSTGQQIWLTTSTDGVTWTPAVQPFRNSTYCNNPVSGSALEWQPNLVVVGTELWCTWTGLYGYISKLTTPTGKWTNYRFEYSGTSVFMSSTIAGAATGGHSLTVTTGGHSDFFAFFTENPIILSSGEIVCPVVYQSASLSSQTTATSPFIRGIKFAALLKTTDGSTWSMTIIDTTSFGDFCPWEPFVVENPIGYVDVFIRNLNTLAVDKDMQLVARSLDGGATFSAAVSTGMLVPSSRGFANKISDNRWLMTHLDHPQLSDQTPNQAFSANVRHNGALFMSRRGVDDFVPGVNFSGAETVMNYPQFVTVGDALYVNYTSGSGSSQRRSLRIVKVTPLPDDSLAYIHPRSANALSSQTGTDPTLHAVSPPYYEFNGRDQALSAATLTASAGVTYTAWIRWDYESDALIDTRQSSSTAFGQVFFLRGLAISSLNFFHNVTLTPGVPTFLAAALDNTADTVTLYISQGSAFTTVTGFFKSILFSGQPANLDTLTVNGVTYTFKTTASLTNDVAIAASTALTITNLTTKLAANSITAAAPGANRVAMTRTDLATFSVSTGSSQITVETGLPLNGGVASIGKKAVSTSSLVGFAGKMFEGRIYASALSAANMTSLFNAKAAALGYSTLGGTSTAPGAPFLIYDPSSPNTTNFPLLGVAGYCETVDASTLKIHGEGSAGVELPYGATELVIRYKISNTPTSTDKYVIATFGTVEYPVRLYVDATHPTSLYANGLFVASVADPTVYNTVTIIVSTNKITIGGFELFFSGKPRCFLGSAFPENLLGVSKSITFDVAAMSAELALSA